MQRRSLIALAALAPLGTTPAWAADEIRIAHVHSKTGPLEAYGRQTQAGLMIGLNYATEGTMMVAGRKITIIEKDDQGKPDLGRSLLASAYADDKVDLAIGPTSSGVALAMLPIAAEYKKILIVEPAVADSITGKDWNKYIFRTARNSSQDAISNAVAVDGDDTSIVTLAQDYAFGRDGVTAFKAALKKARIVHEEYLPQSTTDFTAGIQRVIDALKDKPGRKLVFVIWAGSTTPFPALADADLKTRHGIEVSSGGNILAAMVAYKRFPGMEGATYYYYGIPQNPLNDFLIKENQKEFGEPPDFFTCGGFATAMAVVTALKATHGDTGTNKLIQTMEGMSFETPKGKMTFRKEDHQAMQDMFHFRIKVVPDVKWGVPELVSVITPDQMRVPILNGR